MVAVELNPCLCEAAIKNLEMNNITNVRVIACDSQKYALKILKQRYYRFEKKKIAPCCGGNEINSSSHDTNTYDMQEEDKGVEWAEGDICQFQAVLVDPPRCGLDATTLALVGEFEYIIYISCNPVALQRDLIKVRH